MESQAADVLVVEDDPGSLKYLLSLLSREGYRVRTARNGESALRSARRKPPDLVLLDVVLPDLDGFEVCDWLKSDPGSAVPVIFLTAIKGEPRDIVRGFSVGGVDYVTKPFTAEELLARVRTHLELKRLRDHLAGQVSRRTAELESANVELERMNTTREVLLKQMEWKREQQEDNVVHSVGEMVLPLLSKLERSGLTGHQQQLTELIRDRLRALISPFAKNLSSPAYGLTNSELQVAEMIRERKRTKEIAHLLGVSEKTVVFHRNSIRQKLDLVGRKVNLATYLENLGRRKSWDE